MFHIPTADSVSDLDPVIISSPTIRCGTTLLQRLLCSASNTLIYGETCGQDLEFYLSVYASKVMVYQHNRQQFVTRLERFRKGEVNDWILDLMPDIDAYVRELGRSSFAGLAFCRDYAVSLGRPVWGVKYPGWQPHIIRLIRQMMPKSRWIYIHRDIFDCLKSAKARHSVVSLADVRQFCALWTANLAYAVTIRDDPNVLFLAYDRLLAQPEESLDKIESFSGARGIRRDVLGRKVNTWAEAQSGAGYIPPAELSEEERRIVTDATSAIRLELYP